MVNRNSHTWRGILAIALSFTLIITCIIPSVSVYAESTDENDDISDPNTETEYASYSDGTYEGSGNGRNGLITVRVTITDGVIAKVEEVSQQETEGYWEDARIMLDQYEGKTSADDVDSVSGATLSCDGIRDAVRDALRKASGSIYGAGTITDPYVISSSDQLELFASRIDGGDSDYTSAYVVLGADIDLSSIENWNPIGVEGKLSKDNTGMLFGGTFDGRGYTISSMKISGEYSSETNLGLFSTLAKTARISNIVMSDISINATTTGSMAKIRAGGIAGDTERGSDGRAAVIDGCSAAGTVTVSSSDGQAVAGGIIGRIFTYSAIINSVSYADAYAASDGEYNSSYAGSLAGMTGNNTVVANCAALGSSGAENTSGGADAYAGGLAGMLTSTVYNSYAIGTHTITQKSGVSKAFVGSLAGQLAASPGGAYNYYSSDAYLAVIDEEIDARAWSTDDMTGKATAEDPLTDEYMRSEDFALLLNSNMADVISRLGEPEFAMREWACKDGKVILTDNIWEPGDIDSSVFESGSGSAEDPYTIATEEQLRAFADSLSSKIDYRDAYIKLTDDIYVSGSDWKPIGGSYYRFNGDFDGNGKTIRGLTKGTESEPAELDADSAYVGLFGWINEHAKIHNLTLEGVKIYTHSTGSAYVGGIAGRMSGSDTEGDYHGANIDSCSVNGVIVHTSDKGTSFVGGIAGHMFKGTVINSMTDVTMNARELSGELIEVGGMVGLLNRGLVANSYALGNVTGSGYRDITQDIEGMACVGNIAAVNGGYIANCYAQGDVEALEYSIDTGIITGWVTGIAKVYDCWYNEDASMKIDGRVVSPVDPFGETVAGGVSDEWGFRFPGSLLENNNGYHPTEEASKVAQGLNSSFVKFPIDIEGVYGLSADSLREWTVEEGQAVLGSSSATVTYVQPEVEKNIVEEPERTMLDGTWYGRSNDKTSVVCIKVTDGEITDTVVKSGERSGEAFDEAVARARFKAMFGDMSDYEPADKNRFKGSGTEKDPYKIETEEQLRYLASSINEDVDWQGVHFLQTKDITVSGEDWTPIGWGIFADADDDGFGQDVVALYPFRGSYDGAGHIVKGLKAGSKGSPAAGNYMGLFGIVQGGYTSNEIPDDGYRAVLKNIRVEDAEFYTENRWRSYVGGLVANAQGGITIDNCNVTGTVNSRSTEDFAFAGGLAGSLMYGSVTDTGTKVDSSAWSGKNYSYAGGMSGTTNRVTIVDSYTLGDVHSDADQTNRAEAGGFIALDGGTCINCYARGNVEIVSKYSMYIGGFTGMAASSSEHRQCYYNKDASQKVAGKETDEKRYAGKFVNESAESNAQAQSIEVMSSDKFIDILESNRKNLAETLKQVRATVGADENGSSKYHSVYYNGDGSDLREWKLVDGVAVHAASLKTDDSSSESSGKPGATKPETKKIKKIKTITVNSRTVNKKAIDKAIKKAGGSAKYVTTIVLGKKVRKISKGTFNKYPKLKTLTIKSRKLKKSSVKGSLKGSKVKTIRIKTGSKKVNKKYAKKYKKIFTKKNAGRKVKVKY